MADKKKYSTLSAITGIYNKLYYNNENSIISVLLSMDFLATYDTVDTEILLKKLKYHVSKGKFHNILK